MYRERNGTFQVEMPTGRTFFASRMTAGSVSRSRGLAR